MTEKFTCPSGHEVTPEQLHSTVDLNVRDIDDAVVFDCSGGKRGHTFTLRRAVQSGMFTEDQAAKIRAGAIQHRARYKNSEGA
jgi:hypothetical protein